MKVARRISALDRSAGTGFGVLVVVLVFSVMNCTAQQPPDNWWQKYSGYVRLTPLESGESFAQMQAQLPTLYSEGIRVIEVFGPYEAGPDYGGLSAIDFLAPSTGGGSMTDFQNLVNAAHAQGMAIIIFLANDYIHHTNAWWTTALNNPASTEHGYFLWSSSPAKASLTVATGSASASAVACNTRIPFPAGTLAVALCCLGSRKRRRGQLLPPLAVGLIGVSLLIGCGGSSSHHPTTLTVTVIATASSLQHTATFSLTVQ